MDLSNVKNAKPLYLQGPHIGEAKVTGKETSEDVENYKGKPFINYFFSVDGMKSKGKFWLPADGDSDTKRNNKLLKLRRFFVDCGIDVDTADPKKLDEMPIGKSINGAFEQRSYVRIDKQTGEPNIGTIVELAWSNPVGKPFGPSINVESLTRALDPKEKDRYDALVAKFKGSAATSSESSIDDEGATNGPLDDDAPF